MIKKIPPESIQEIFEILEENDGSITDLMKAIGLNPATDFRGGDWRGCFFGNLDLRGFNFQNSRLESANFEKAQVALADFRGAQIFKSRLHLAIDWPDAVLDDFQRDYLRSIAARENVNLRDLEVRESKDESLNVWEYVQLMKTATDYPSARKLYDRMIAKSIKPNEHVFATLMDKANDMNVSLALLGEAEKKNIQIDEPIYTALISNSRTYDEALKMFTAGKKHLGFSTAYPFNSLINKSPSFNDANLIIQQMWAEGPPPDRVTINAALNIPWGPNNSEYYNCAELIRQGLHTNIDFKQADFAALLRRARTVEDISIGLNLLGQASLERNVEIETAIISVTPEFSNAIEIYNSALERGMKPDKHIFYALLKVSKNQYDAFEVLARMQKARLAFDEKTIERVILKTPDPDRARALRQQIELAGESDPAAVIRGLVIISADDESRKFWLDRIFPLH